MIKQYSIGRGDDCQIKIQDNSQKVSRNHATIKVLDNGKIFITDHSSNGTFVNGVKISPSVDYPVKRGDDVSFAHVANLNWELIPSVINKLIFFIVGVVIVIGLIITVYFLFSNPKPCPPINDQKQDSVRVEKTDSVKQKNTTIIDSTQVAKKEKNKIQKDNSGETHKAKTETKSKKETKATKQKGEKPSKNDSIKKIII